MEPQTSSTFLNSLGFAQAPFFHEYESIEQVVEACMDQNIKNQLDAMDIEFDGLVIKVNNNNLRELLGSTNHHPRRAIVYKYPAKQARSIINTVEWQVGRTGILTPVANIQPVSLSGVKISRVALHNPDFIREKDIHIGDNVIIQRSWEVIPYIVCTIPELRDGTQTEVIKPEFCPVCKEAVHELIADSGNTSYYCLNTLCPASTKEKIKHFVSRDMMDIEGMGDAIIDAMVDHHIINTYADLYQLHQPHIRMVVKNLPGMGDKKIDWIIKGLENSKTKDLHKIIYALGIPQVGEKTAKILVDHIKNDPNFHTREINPLDKLIHYLSDVNFLSSIHSIWPQTIESISDWTRHQGNIDILKKLESYGVQFDNFEEERTDSQRLQYLRFAVSGIFPISRDQIISTLVKQWAVYNPNITKNTNLVIAGLNPSSKIHKAQKQNIEISDDLKALEARFEVDFGIESVWLF